MKPDWMLDARCQSSIHSRESNMDAVALKDVCKSFSKVRAANVTYGHDTAAVLRHGNMDCRDTSFDISADGLEKDDLQIQD